MPSMVTAELVWADDLSLIRVLDKSSIPAWQDDLAGAGSASITLAHGDPSIDDIGIDTAVMFKIDDVIRFRGVPLHAEDTLIDKGEEHDEATVVTFAGPLAYLANAVVYPTGGVGRLPIETDRIFSWPSPAPIYDDSSWTNAGQMGTVSDPHPYWTVPEGWPAASAAQIIGSPDYDDTEAPVGSIYLRRVVTLAGAANCVVYVAADNASQVWVDGVRFLTTTQAAGQAGLTSVNKFSVTLSAGDHLIAAQVDNQPLFFNPDPGPVLGNPIGFVLDAFNLNGDGTLGSSLFSTDDTWVGMFFPDVAPGITVGRLLRVMIEEAQARGVVKVADLTLDFDDDNDSAGNPWVGTTDASTKVGYTYPQFFGELAAYACDMEWRHEADVFSAWAYGTRGQ